MAMCFLQSNDVQKSIFSIISFASWLFFISTGIASVVFLSNRYGIIWTIEKKGFYNYSGTDCYPLQMNVVFIFMVFIITILFGISSFIFMFIKREILKSMLRNWPRLHFFPLIIVSFLFLLGEGFYPIYDKLIKKDFARYYSHIKLIRVFGFCLSVIALVIFIFLYYITDFRLKKWYIILTPKKGAYSCLITLLWYYFFYSLYQLIEISFPGTDNPNFCKIKFISIFFSILFGSGSIFFSIFFKDLMVGIMNILINLGMTFYFFQINIYIRYSYYEMEYAIGIIDIVIMVIQAGVITFLLIKHRDKCFFSEIKKNYLQFNNI